MIKINPVWKVLEDVINEINLTYQFQKDTETINLDGNIIEIKIKKLIPKLVLNRKLYQGEINTTIVMSLEIDKIVILQFSYLINNNDLELGIIQGENIFVKNVIINGLLYKSLDIKEATEYRQLTLK